MNLVKSSPSLLTLLARGLLYFARGHITFPDPIESKLRICQLMTNSRARVALIVEDVHTWSIAAGKLDHLAPSLVFGLRPN